MCPSGGQEGGHWVRLRRSLRETLSGELQPVVLLCPAALTLLLVVYLFPLLSTLVLCGAGCWAYHNSWPSVWRFPEWRRRLEGAAGGRVRPVPHRRHRDPVSKWSPSHFLLLMGSYLGKPEPPARELGRGAQGLKERLSRPNPTVLTPARRLSFRETPQVSTRTYMSPRRRYPIHQPQYSMPGSLPTVYLDSYQRKCLLSPKTSTIRSPVTVKIARPDPNITRSPVLHNLLSPGPTSPSVQCVPNPCAKETVLNAIRESRKRINKDEDYNSSRESEIKRRRQASSGSRESFFESPVENGTLSSYGLRPDNLKRGLNTPLLDENVTKRSRTSSNSSLYSSSINGIAMSAHNAITSSYSSSRDLLQKRKRVNLNTSAVSSSPSSRSQTPDLATKKAREEPQDISPSNPVGSVSREQSGQFNEIHSSKSSAGNSSFDNGSGGNRRKKVLLVCSGPSDNYPMLPPVAGYRITSKDFDAEKKAFLQRLNMALEETPDSLPVSSVPSTTASSPVPTTLFSLPTTTQPTLVVQTSSANSNPLLQSLAKMQNKEDLQAPAHTVNGKVPTLTLSSINEPSKVNSLHPPSQPAFTTAVTLGSTTTPQPAQAAQPTAESPKNSLQTIANSLESASQSGFKPLFPTNEGVNQPTSSSILLSTTSLSATNTLKPVFGEQSSQQSQPADVFKPIFGDQNSQQGQPAGKFKQIFGDPAAQQPVSSTSPFASQMNSAAASSTSFSGFVATTTSATSITDSNAKPSMSLPNSSSTTTSFSLSLFPSTGAANSVSAPNSVNPFTGSKTSADSQAKSTNIFGQKLTSQETSNLPVFGNAQTSISQPQQPPMFGSTTSAFTVPLVSNSPAFPANSGSSTFNSGSGGTVQADKPTPSPLTSFGATEGQTAFNAGTPSFVSSSQPTFGGNSQSAFGTNSNFNFGPAPATSKAAPFGSMNNTQTISNTTNLFGASKPFTFGETTSTAASFGTNSATTPASSFGNSSIAPSNTNPCTPNFGTPAPTENKIGFATPFGSNSSTGFGLSTPAAFASPVTSFSQSSPGFSIGSSKHSGTRQRVSARRQHPRKK